MAAGKLGTFDHFKNLGEDFIGRKKELAEIQSYFSEKSNRMPRVLISMLLQVKARPRLPWSTAGSPKRFMVASSGLMQPLT
jgi:hypothetical protein